jgi:PBP1b-binding outer membrane lipoprotein LpoB
MKLQIALIGIAAILLSGCGNIKSVARYTPPTNQSGVKTGDTAKTQPPDLP